MLHCRHDVPGRRVETWGGGCVGKTTASPFAAWESNRQVSPPPGWSWGMSFFYFITDPLSTCGIFKSMRNAYEGAVDMQTSAVPGS